MEILENFLSISFRWNLCCKVIVAKLSFLSLAFFQKVAQKYTKITVKHP